MVSEKGMLRIWGGEENQGRSEYQVQAKEELILPAVWTLTRGAFASLFLTLRMEIRPKLEMYRGLAEARTCTA